MAYDEGTKRDRQPSDVRLLKLLRLIVVSDAVLIFPISYYLMTGFGGIELVPAVLSLAFAGFFYGMTFFVGCLIF